MRASERIRANTKGDIDMCLSAALIGGSVLAGSAIGVGASAANAHKQREAAKKASREARAASLNAQSMADSERNLSAAQEAAEERVAELGDTDMSVAKRRRGVSSTYLNDTLGV